MIILHPGYNSTGAYEMLIEGHLLLCLHQTSEESVISWFLKYLFVNSINNYANEKYSI